MKLRRLVTVLVIIPAFGAELARAQAPSGDLAKIQGRWWTKTAIGTSGRSKIHVIDIEGDRVTTSESKRPATQGAEPKLEVQSTGQIRLDEAASPKTMDMFNTKSANAQLGEIKLPDAFSIYEIDGDTVKICANVGLVNRTRPRTFQANPRAGFALTTWSRVEPPADLPPAMARAKAAAEKPARVAKPVKVEKLETFRGVTVVGIADRTISFKAGNGDPFTTGTHIAQAFDAQGNKVARGLDTMVAGNVLDLTLIFPDKPTDPYQIKEARIVRGDVGHVVLQSNAPAAKGKGKVTYLKTPDGPGETYQGAVITKVEANKITLSVDGKLVEMGRPNAATAAYDLAGTKLRSPAEDQLLKVGNKVDVILKPRPADPRFMPHVVSIRLVEGQLTGSN